MQIPSSIKVGRKKYSVSGTRNLPKNLNGRVHVLLRQIHISHDSPNKPLTFWHEVTHAILHDMDDARWKDEKFVTQFSKRLAGVIKSAEF